VSSDVIERSLAENRRRLVERLRWPENLGIGLRDLNVGGVPGTPALLVWIDGLAGNEVLQEAILRPLTEYQGSTAPELLAQMMPVPDRTWEQQLDRVLGRILEGWTALLVDGWDAALLLDTIDRPSRPAWQSFHVYRESFSVDLRQNVTLLRKRVRDPRLRALPSPCGARTVETSPWSIWKARHSRRWSGCSASGSPATWARR
jgi:hypothetical protein